MNQKLFYVIIGLVLVSLLAALGFAYRAVQINKSISSYDACVAAGFPIMESFPPQCAVPGTQHLE